MCSRRAAQNAQGVVTVPCLRDISEKVKGGSHQAQRPRAPTGQAKPQGDRPSARSELLGDRERAPRRGPRTADQIKEAYGRPTSKK